MSQLCMLGILGILPVPDAVRPNIVLIVADDLGWADLGCYGNRFNETPHLDRLARQGVLFTDAYSAGPVCSPTRAALMSGQYQARFGLTAHIPGHWRPFEKLAEPPTALAMPREIVTIAERLKDSGYATAHFGKWHLGGRGFSPADQGFDEVFEFGQHTVPARLLTPPSSQNKRLAAHLADLAIQFIERQRRQPFFVQVCHFAVHIPLDTTPELERKYSSKRKAPGYSCHPLYAGLLEELDSSVGRVLAALDRLGIADQTLVVFTSDNGGLEREAGGWPGTLNRPLRGEKGSLYEGGIRVPLIVRGPGVAAGSVTRTPAISCDLYPTLLEIAKLAHPANQACDGLSLVPVLQKPAESPPRSAIARLPHVAGNVANDALYWHYPHYHHSRPSGAIRRQNWKLIEFFDSGETELYDLSNDLSENTNLAQKNPVAVELLRATLREWRLRVNAQMPQPNPAYNPMRAGEWWSRQTIQPVAAPGTYRPTKKAT